MLETFAHIYIKKEDLLDKPIKKSKSRGTQWWSG